MRMEEKFTEAKLAASAPLKESSLLTKKSPRTEKPAVDKAPADLAPQVATKPESPVTTTPPPRRTSPSRRPPSRSANRNQFGKPTHSR
jgi:hypothetical protein